MSNKHVASELSRALCRQTELDPSTDAYTVLMRNIELLACSTEMFDSIAQYIEGSELPTTPVPFEPTPFPEPTPVSAPAEPPVETESEETYDMTEVRAALVEARRNGANVASILRGFGVENFSAFPAGKYGELMARLRVKS